MIIVKCMLSFIFPSIRSFSSIHHQYTIANFEKDGELLLLWGAVDRNKTKCYVFHSWKEELIGKTCFTIELASSKENAATPSGLCQIAFILWLDIQCAMTAFRSCLQDVWLGWSIYYVMLFIANHTVIQPAPLPQNQLLQRIDQISWIRLRSSESYWYAKCRRLMRLKLTFISRTTFLGQ